MKSSRLLKRKRNILMVIGAIVVVIILIHIYNDFTAQPPLESPILEINDEVSSNKILRNYELLKNL